MDWRAEVGTPYEVAGNAHAVAKRLGPLRSPRDYDAHCWASDTGHPSWDTEVGYWELIRCDRPIGECVCDRAGYGRDLSATRGVAQLR